MKMLNRNLNIKLDKPEKKARVDSFGYSLNIEVPCHNCEKIHDLFIHSYDCVEELNCECGAVIMIEYEGLPEEYNIEVFSDTTVDGETVHQDKVVLCKDFHDFRNLLKIIKASIDSVAFLPIRALKSPTTDLFEVALEIYKNKKKGL